MKNGLYSLCLIVLIVCVIGSNAAAKTLITKYEDQTSSASVRPVRVNGQAGVAVEFEGTDDLHYYATAEGAPAPHLKLKVSAAADGVGFSPAIFPEHEYFNDAVKGKIEVFVGNFTVFIPLAGEPVLNAAKPKNATVTIEGIACTSELCLSPFTEKISTPINLMFDEWPSIDFKAGDLQETAPVVPDPQPETDTAVAVVDTGLSGILADWNNSSDAETASSKSVLWYFLLAILAGLSINIMPCVLPVIPLIIMRLVGQAKESGSRRVALGFSFCGGIILFFAAFAIISVVIKLSTGVAIDLNSIYRNPAAVITLFLFIVFFALVLLDILVITLPGSVSGHQSGGGFAGSIGMGFFAGILSTPCSGAIIGAVLVWAQTQHPAVSSTALVLMGVGMA
ncbi:MAG: cytochrome c biogenesis protein CcdA, partial [Planctomycetota bacterium]